MRRPPTATVIASTALFFSLGGASMAASHYLITSTNQIKPSVRQALREKPVAASAMQQTFIYVEGPQATVPQQTPGFPGERVQADCPSGDIATGGGFNSGGGYATLSEPTNPVTNSTGFLTGQVQGWSANIINPSSDPIAASAWVMCAQAAQ